MMPSGFQQHSPHQRGRPRTRINPPKSPASWQDEPLDADGPVDGYLCGVLLRAGVSVEEICERVAQWGGMG